LFMQVADISRLQIDERIRNTLPEDAQI
jgi:hypothetical protein